MNKLRGVIIVFIVFALLLIVPWLPGVAASGASVSFSPQKVWEADLNNDVSTVTPWVDINGDNLAEIEVDIENASAHTYSIVLLNGKDGSILHKVTFTDVAYPTNPGENYAVEPTLFTETYLNEEFQPTQMYAYMVFSNYSDLRHLSIYQVSYDTLENLTYTSVEVPDTVEYMGQSVSVTSYLREIRIINAYNQTPLLVYFGAYLGTVLNYLIGDMEVKVFDYNLNTLWNKKESIGINGDISSIGYNVIGFDGYGVNGYGENIVRVEVSSTTKISMLNASTGAIIWNATLSGMPLMNIPTFALSQPVAYTLDYDRNHKMDLVVFTYTNSGGKIWVIDSSGAIKAEKDVEGMCLMSLYTDTKPPTGIPSPHLMLQSIDVNGDGYGEIFYVDNNTYFTALDIENNATLWSYTLSPIKGAKYFVDLSTNDVNGDGAPDVYLVSQKSSTTSYYNVTLSAIDSTNGQTLWTRDFNYTTFLFPGTLLKSELSDLNGDGVQDAVVASEMGVDPQGTYVNIAAVDMKTGNTIWKVKIYAEISNTDFPSWISMVSIVGDLNDDGINDVGLLFAHHNMQNRYWNYIKYLSGVDGSVIWQGKVENDTNYTRITPFSLMYGETGIAQFDYNGDGLYNELLIVTGDPVYIYSISQPIPEINGIALILVPLAVLALAVLMRRR